MKKKNTFKSLSKSQGGMISFSLIRIFSVLILLIFWTNDEINLLCCSLHSNTIETMFGKLLVIQITKFCLSSVYAVHSDTKVENAGKSR